MIVEATERHVLSVVRRMDPEELKVAKGTDPRREVLGLSRQSAWCRAWIVDGRCLAVGGVVGTLASSDGLVWLATTREIETQPRQAVIEARRGLAEIMTGYRRLEAVIPAARERDVRFAEFLGFRFGGVESLNNGMLVRRGELRQEADGTVASACPFTVHALPRSRTAWLARFLSYGPWKVAHEQSVFLKDIRDLTRFYAQPFTGSVETAASPGWRILRHRVPRIRQAVIRRPVEEVVESMMRVEFGGRATLDRRSLRDTFGYLERVMAEISGQPGVLTVDYRDLDRQETISALFEHCLGMPFDAAWWQSRRQANIQIDVPEFMLYCASRKERIDGFKAECRREMRRLARAGIIAKERPSWPQPLEQVSV